MGTKLIKSTQEVESAQVAGVRPSDSHTLEQKSPTKEIQEKKSLVPDVQVKARRTAPRRQFSTTYKLKIIEKYDACTNALARGSLLRKEGLYHSLLSNWRKQCDEGKVGNSVQQKTPKTLLINQKLSRENAKLKKQLAQAEAIIDLQKKVSELLGQHILPLETSETS